MCFSYWHKFPKKYSLYDNYIIMTLCVGVVEVLKGMQELGVSPDVETLSSYILPVFPSMEAARQTLKVVPKCVCVLICLHVCTKKVFAIKHDWSSLFRMQGFLWSQRASCLQRFVWWLSTTWPNSTACVSAHTDTLAHLNTFQGSSTTSWAAVIIKIAALPAG